MSGSLTPEQQLPATWYRIKPYGSFIEATTVYKVTPQFVYIKFSALGREHRVSRDEYFQTWEAAQAALVESFERKVGYASDELHRLRSVMGQVKSLRKPA